MTATTAETTVRDEIHALVDEMPERKLYALRELLDARADEEYWKPAIETDLTDEEKEIIAEGRRQYAEHPETFTSLDDVVKDYRAFGKFVQRTLGTE
jgi:hypothetical protein